MGMYLYRARGRPHALAALLERCSLWSVLKFSLCGFFLEINRVYLC